MTIVLRLPLLLAGMLFLTAACAGARPDVPRSSAPSPVALVADSVPPLRTVLLHRDISMTAMDWYVELQELAPGVVTGRMYVTVSDGRDSPYVAREFGCHFDSAPSDSTPTRCDVPYVRGKPDWASALRRLDALGIMAPPRDLPPPPPVPDARGLITTRVCTDGSWWGLTVSRRDTVVVRDSPSLCGEGSRRRLKYEAGVDAIVSELTQAGWLHPDGRRDGEPQ